MPRLVTFGCSFVYGHGLPDCHIPPNIPALQPSKMGWANMVADKLGIPCLNLANPEIGNLAILMKVLNAELRPDDIVVTAFSYFDRYFCHQFVDKEGKGVLINKDTPEHKRILMSEIDEPFLEEKYYWHNWLAIQHVELYLGSKNIKNFSFHGVQNGCEQKPPASLELNNFWNDMILVTCDYALDGRHPGMESNRLQAEQIYNRIQHELR